MNKVANTVKLPNSRFEQLLKASRKRYRWAIGTDVILIIAFVIICSLSYKILIDGAIYGDAIHCVPELNNESYDYWSSDESLSDGDMDNQID